MSKDFSQKSQDILKQIKKAENILLHLHPKPDPDSVGSALAMKFALEQLDKKVTVIEGDTEFPESFNFLPGANDIVHKNYFETDLSDFDLFIILDSSSSKAISREDEVTFPENLHTIQIDHHKTTNDFTDFSLVDSKAVATGEILFYLFKDWGIEITKDIAANLYIAIYGDSGSFSYPTTTSKTLRAVAELVDFYPDFRGLIISLEKNMPRDFISFATVALSNLETFADDKIAMVSISKEELEKNNIDFDKVSSSFVPNLLISVKGWEVGITLAEIEKDKIKMSIRSKKVDISKLAEELGGGGHALASGVYMEAPFETAKQRVKDVFKNCFEA
jgi:phosphoesterase RecJ-like protein